MTQMNLTTMLKAADLCYHYSDEDKAIIRHMAMTDKAGLTESLESDKLIPWTAYQHGLIDEAPNAADKGPGGSLPGPA